MLLRKNALLTILLLLSAVVTMSQEKIINPDISYTAKVRMCTIAGIAVSGGED